MASVLHNILKYSILILSLINVVLFGWYLIDGLLNKRLNTENVAYLVIMLLIFIVGACAAYTEDFLYLIIFGVIIVVGLTVNFLIKYDLVLGRGGMIVLAVLVFVFSFVIKNDRF